MNFHVLLPEFHFDNSSGNDYHLEVFILSHVSRQNSNLASFILSQVNSQQQQFGNDYLNWFEVY